MSVSEEHLAFAQIIGGLEDPEDRLDRRTSFRGYATGLIGFLILLLSHLTHLSLPAIGLGLLLMFYGNVVGLTSILRVRARRRAMP